MRFDESTSSGAVGAFMMPSGGVLARTPLSLLGQEKPCCSGCTRGGGCVTRRKRGRAEARRSSLKESWLDDLVAMRRGSELDPESIDPRYRAAVAGRYKSGQTEVLQQAKTIAASRSIRKQFIVYSQAASSVIYKNGERVADEAAVVSMERKYGLNLAYVEVTGSPTQNQRGGRTTAHIPIRVFFLDPRMVPAKLKNDASIPGEIEVGFSEGSRGVAPSFYAVSQLFPKRHTPSYDHFSDINLDIDDGVYIRITGGVIRSVTDQLNIELGRAGYEKKPLAESVEGVKTNRASLLRSLMKKANEGDFDDKARTAFAAASKAFDEAYSDETLYDENQLRVHAEAASLVGRERSDYGYSFYFAVPYTYGVFSVDQTIKVMDQYEGEEGDAEELQSLVSEEADKAKKEGMALVLRKTGAELPVPQVVDARGFILVNLRDAPLNTSEVGQDPISISASDLMAVRKNRIVEAKSVKGSHDVSDLMQDLVLSELKKAVPSGRFKKSSVRLSRMPSSEAAAAVGKMMQSFPTRWGRATA